MPLMGCVSAVQPDKAIAIAANMATEQARRPTATPWVHVSQSIVECRRTVHGTMPFLVSCEIEILGRYGLQPLLAAAANESS